MRGLVKILIFDNSVTRDVRRMRRRVAMAIARTGARVAATPRTDAEAQQATPPDLSAKVTRGGPLNAGASSLRKRRESNGSPAESFRILRVIAMGGTGGFSGGRKDFLHTVKNL